MLKNLKMMFNKIKNKILIINLKINKIIAG